MAKTRDANRILDEITKDDEELQQMVAEEMVNAEVGRLTYRIEINFVPAGGQQKVA